MNANQAEMSHIQDSVKARGYSPVGSVTAGGNGTAAPLPVANAEVAVMRPSGTPGLATEDHAAAPRSAAGEPAGLGGMHQADDSDESGEEVGSGVPSPLSISPGTLSSLSAGTAAKLVSMGMVVKSRQGQRLDFDADDGEDLSDPSDVEVADEHMGTEQQERTKAFAGKQMEPSTGPLSALSSNAPASRPITVAPPSSAPAASSPPTAGAVVNTNATDYTAWAQAPSSSAAAGHLGPLAAPSPAPATSSPTVAAAAGSTYPAMYAGQASAPPSYAGAGRPVPLAAPAPASATSTPATAAAPGDSRAAVYTGHLPALSPYGGNAALFAAPSPASATSWPAVAAAAGNTAASVNSGQLAAPSSCGATPYPPLSAAASPASAASSPVVAAAAAAAATAAAYTGQVPTPSPFGAAGFPPQPSAYPGFSATSSPAAAGAASILHPAVPIRLAPAPVSNPPATPAPPAPLSSPAVNVAAGSGATVPARVLKPNFDLWAVKDLRQEATRQAGRNTALTYGPLPENVVRQVSNARKDELVQALDARLKWREQLAQPPEWTDIPIGTTPEKKKQKREASIAKAKKKAGKKETVESDVQGFCCRMVCLMMQPDFLDLYVKSKGGSTGIARAEQDEGAVGFRHVFYHRLARAMATVQWRDADGRPLSVPDDHAHDDKAPDALKSRLASLPDDMERSAVTLHNDLERFDGDDNAFYLELQRRIFQWVKDVQANHTVFKANEAQSGGAGADPTDDGGFEDAIHPWQFMAGRLPTMLWEDGCRVMGGGNSLFTGEVILPDDSVGSGSSIPGGPGVRSVAANSRANAGAGVRVKSERKKKTEAADAERAKLTDHAAEVMKTLMDTCASEARDMEISRQAAREAAWETRVDNVERLEKKVAETFDPSRQAMYRDLLGLANQKLQEALTEMAAAAAAATSSAISAKRPVGSGGGAGAAALEAVATPMAAGNGAGAGAATPPAAATPTATGSGAGAGAGAGAATRAAATTLTATDSGVGACAATSS